MTKDDWVKVEGQSGLYLDLPEGRSAHMYLSHVTGSASSEYYYGLDIIGKNGRIIKLRHVSDTAQAFRAVVEATNSLDGF